MIFILSIIFVLLPFMPMIYLVYRVQKLDNFINTKKVIRDMEISIVKLKDILPNQVEAKLKKNAKIVDSLRRKVIKKYKWCFCAFLIYFFCGVVYITGIIVAIVLMFIGFFAKTNSVEFGMIIGCVTMCILEAYWFFLMPIFRYFELKIMEDIGYILWSFLRKLTNKIVDYLKNAIMYLVGLVISCFILYYYTYLVKLMFDNFKIGMNLWLVLIAFMLYQYMILHILACVVFVVMKWLTKKMSIINKYIEKYCDIEVLYGLIKNGTYLSMVIVYAIALEADKANTPIAAAIGILFLFDSFVMQDNSIRNSIKK